MVLRAHTAVDRFTEARAAMAHGILLRENAPKQDIAALQSYMKDLRDDLTTAETRFDRNYRKSVDTIDWTLTDWSPKKWPLMRHDGIEQPTPGHRLIRQATWVGGSAGNAGPPNSAR